MPTSRKDWADVNDTTDHGYFSSSYDTKSLTAKSNMHFKAANGKQLAFAPGAIYKEINTGVKDNRFKGNRTFQLIFSSPQSSVIFKGAWQVNVTIMYTTGKK